MQQTTTSCHPLYGRALSVSSGVLQIRWLALHGLCAGFLVSICHRTILLNLIFKRKTLVSWHPNHLTGKTSDILEKMVPSQLHRTSSGADGGWLFHANGFWNFWASENPNHKDSEAPHIFTNRHIYTWLNTYSMQERNFFKTSTLKKWLGLSSWYWTSRWNFRDFGFLHDYIPQFHAIPNGYNTIQRSFFTPIESRWMKPPRRT